MKPTDKDWINGYFDGYRSGQISLLDLIQRKNIEDQPYRNGLNEPLPWEDDQMDGDETI